MAKRKRSSKSRSKKRRRIQRKPYNQMVSSRAPFSRSFITKLRYCTYASLDAGLGTISTHLFSANNIFDPDVTGSGHQPLGHDELAALYDHYTVLGAKISVTAMPSNGYALVGLAVDDNSSPDTDYDSIQEQPENRWLAVSSNQGPRTISRKLSIKKFFNANLKGSDKLSATFGSSPADQAYFVLWCKGSTAGADPSSVDFNITIEYIVRCTEPKQLLKS